MKKFNTFLVLAWCLSLLFPAASFAKEWTPRASEIKLSTQLLNDSVQPRGDFSLAQCSANAIVDQAFDATNGPTARNSDVASDLLVAENISANGAGAVVSTGQADSITFWGIQVAFQDGVGFTGSCDPSASDFIITSWSDAGNAPDQIIDSETVTASATDTGEGFAFTTVYEFQASLSGLDLDNAGWISVQREETPPVAPATGCFFLWVDNDPGQGDALSLQIDLDASEITLNESDQSMCLEGSAASTAPAISGNEVIGLRFDGSVTGINGSDAWAADMRLDLQGPGATRNALSIGGIDNPAPVDWDFAGPGSTADGTYSSTHYDFFFVPADLNGDWTITFTNDWAASPATQCWTGTSVTLFRGNGLEEVLQIPDQCYAAEEFQQVIIPAGTVLPESRPVPVNNFWALGLMALLLAGLGTIVIRRMF